MIRQKFITNSSSTCFYAYGAIVEWDDEAGERPEDWDDLIETDKVGVAGWWNDWDRDQILIYIKDSKQSASEYSGWQGLPHIWMPDAAPLYEFADENNLIMVDEEPDWGLYNSGH